MGSVGGQDSCLPSSVVIPPVIMDVWMDGRSVSYSRFTQRWVSFWVS